MSFFDLLTLFGGLAMFLYGMRLMGDGLKESSSGTLKVFMEKVTNNRVKAFLLGMGITAIIQSSTATIVITSGLVGAGLLTLDQSLGIIVGANVGTTVTGQIIRLLDMDASAGSWLQIFKPSSLAPIALIIGIIMIMAVKKETGQRVGGIAMGFGILFSGLLNMTSAVDTLAESGIVEQLFSGLGARPVVGYLTGAAVAFVLQSSSAAVGILQAFSQSGLLTFRAVYPVIVGIYLGDCVTTAIVCAIGARAEAQRVGLVNILFNLGKSVLVLVVVGLLHRMGFLGSLWEMRVTSGSIANANTIFNLACAVVLFPLMPALARMSTRIVKDKEIAEEPNRYDDLLEGLNPAFFQTPAIALNSCYKLLSGELQAARENLERSFSLLTHYDETLLQEILAEEDRIDLLTDRCGSYIVELMPHLKADLHIAILNQYYKVVAEFEHLSDQAVYIARNADDMKKKDLTLSETAAQELKVLKQILQQTLDETELAFRKRDYDAALRIGPLKEVASNLARDLKESHLSRMGRGECDVRSDANYVNLLSDLKRVADVCINIGEAVIVRVKPELAAEEHDYFSSRRLRQDEDYLNEYNRIYQKYYGMLQSTTES